MVISKCAQSKLSVSISLFFYLIWRHIFQSWVPWSLSNSLDIRAASWAEGDCSKMTCSTFTYSCEPWGEVSCVLGCFSLKGFHMLFYFFVQAFSRLPRQPIHVFIKFIQVWYHQNLICSSQRCNLLFGLIGHFGLLKDVNVSFFLSFFLIQGFGRSLLLVYVCKSPDSLLIASVSVYHDIPHHTNYFMWLYHVCMHWRL